MKTESPAKPWDKPAPKSSTPTKLTPASKEKARKAAAKAGRRYPNMVDNMSAARKQNAAKKRAGKSRP